MLKLVFTIVCFYYSHFRILLKGLPLAVKIKNNNEFINVSKSNREISLHVIEIRYSQI